MLGISDVYGDEQQVMQKLIDNAGFRMHMAIPAVVQSFNSSAQTVEVQPTIRERVIQPDNSITYQQYPLLVNVPIVYPQVGAYSITFPIAKGDECLVIFSDLAIDNWWEHGNVQNPVEQRRHDLSDGIAIFGLKNQAKLEGTTVSNSLLLKNSSGDKFEITASGLNITTKDGYTIMLGNDGITIQKGSTIIKLDGTTTSLKAGDTEISLTASLLKASRGNTTLSLNGSTAELVSSSSKAVLSGTSAQLTNGTSTASLNGSTASLSNGSASVTLSGASASVNATSINLTGNVTVTGNFTTTGGTVRLN